MLQVHLSLLPIVLDLPSHEIVQKCNIPPCTWTLKISIYILICYLKTNKDVKGC